MVIFEVCPDPSEAKDRESVRKIRAVIESGAVEVPDEFVQFATLVVSLEMSIKNERPLLLEKPDGSIYGLSVWEFPAGRLNAVEIPRDQIDTRIGVN